MILNPFNKVLYLNVVESSYNIGINHSLIISTFSILKTIGMVYVTSKIPSFIYMRTDTPMFYKFKVD
jgi:hypothetical protein